MSAPVDDREKLKLALTLITIVLLAGNLLVFGWIAAGIGRISDRIANGDLSFPDPVIAQTPGQGIAEWTGSAPLATSTASGNVVHVTSSGGDLRPGPRTVEDVASYLGVTADTVRDSYIPEWIASGHMTEEDRLKNRWIIPDSFEPYKPK